MATHYASTRGATLTQHILIRQRCIESKSPQQFGQHLRNTSTRSCHTLDKNITHIPFFCKYKHWIFRGNVITSRKRDIKLYTIDSYNIFAAKVALGGILTFHRNNSYVSNSLASLCFLISAKSVRICKFSCFSSQLLL